MGNKQLSLVLVCFLTLYRLYHSNNVILLPLLLLTHKSWNSSTGRICNLKANKINFAIEWLRFFRTEVGKLLIYLFLTTLLTGHITQYIHLKFKWWDLFLKIFGKKEDYFYLCVAQPPPKMDFMQGCCWTNKKSRCLTKSRHYSKST